MTPPDNRTTALGRLAELREGVMSITAQSRTGGAYGAKARIPMLAPTLAALLYPFTLKGFNSSVTSIAEGGAGTGCMGGGKPEVSQAE
jgi:hypothetical protein